jgi:D-xylose 1-dehydrogenase (NADP+, D-xylono-1,5-lactone-forming)
MDSTPARTVGFGVFGASSTIAQKAVIPALLAVDRVRLVAGASRSGGEVAGIDRLYDDYDALLGDSAVDAVYIPLPNHLHAEWAVRAARAGKHVLCEKPLGRTAAEAREIVDACADAGVVLMEAYMTPHHPRSIALSGLVAAGRLGELRHGFACFTGPLEPTNHRWRPETGGGALLDVGIYCLEPLLEAAGWDGGPIPEIVAHSTLGGAGVDASFSGWLRTADGAVLTFLCSMEAPDTQLLHLVGTEGRVVVDQAFIPGWADDHLVITGRDGAEEHLTGGGDPYEGMVADFCAAVLDGRPLRRGPERSVQLQKVIDALRKAVA